MEEVKFNEDFFYSTQILFYLPITKFICFLSYSKLRRCCNYFGFVDGCSRWWLQSLTAAQTMIRESSFTFMCHALQKSFVIEWSSIRLILIGTAQERNIVVVFQPILELNSSQFCKFSITVCEQVLSLGVKDFFNPPTTISAAQFFLSSAWNLSTYWPYCYQKLVNLTGVEYICLTKGWIWTPYTILVGKII